MNSSVDPLKRKQHLKAQFHKQYGGVPDLYVRAPGRVDLIGSHTDYNQGFVLAQAIDRDIWIAARARDDRIISAASLNVDGAASFSLDRIEFDQAVTWSNYVRGVAHMLQAAGCSLRGFDGLIDSTIPIGSGLSSSAALEVATAVLFQALGDWRIEPVELARLCQRAENEFVGVNSGILDQYVSLLGRQRKMLLLDARSLESEAILVADGVAVLICDTKVSRALANSEYEARRAHCERGVDLLRSHYPEVEALRDVHQEQLEEHRQELPPVVYWRCRFVIEENQRVLACAKALSDADHERAGRLMNESFIGGRDLYEIVSPEMSAMHEASMGAPGCYGARGAGAGFGGVLVALVEAGAVEAFADSVRRGYLASTGLETEVFAVRAVAGAAVVGHE